MRGKGLVGPAFRKAYRLVGVPTPLLRVRYRIRAPLASLVLALMGITGQASPQLHRKALGGILIESPYSPPTVDIWSVGCIMAELLQGKALFPGNDCILGEQGQAGVPFYRVGVVSSPFSKSCFLCHDTWGSLSGATEPQCTRGWGWKGLASRCFLS